MHYFNDVALHKFLVANDLDLLVRSHELCNGCYFPYEDNTECITVFSNSDYCGRKNDAAVLTIDGLEVARKQIKMLKIPGFFE